MCLSGKLDFDLLKRIEGLNRPGFIHRDHRWGLCLAHYGQQQEWLPSPCDLVLFDRHDDMQIPSSLDAVRQLGACDYDIDQLIALCQEDLSTADGDWIIAGMELGLIRDVVVFGVEERSQFAALPERYTDAQEREHRIKVLARPIAELGWQRTLADTSKRDINGWVWDILRWDYSRDDGFHFLASDAKLWLDIDLDAFSYSWSDYHVAWNDQIFCAEFNTRSEYRGTAQWTGASFFKGLLDNAGLLTIATEPNHCGGERNSRHILERLNRFVFDSELKIQG